MPVTDEALALGGRGGGQLRGQQLTGQGAPLTKIGGLSDAPPGLGFGDP